MKIPTASHRKILIVFGVVIAGAIGFAATSTRKSHDLTPKLVGPSAIDFGSGEPSTRVTRQFLIANSGHAPLEFQVRKSCGCIGAEPASGVVAPGESLLLTVSLLLPEQPGSEKETHVVLESNDPSRPALSVAIRGRTTSDFRITPSFLSFGDVDISKPEGHTATLVVSAGDSRFEPNSLKVHHSSSAFDIKTAIRPGGESVAIKVSVAERLEVGQYYDTLELRLENGSTRPAVKIPVSAQVVKPIFVVPATVFIDQSDFSERRTASIVVGARDRASTLPEVSILNPPSGVVIHHIDQIAPYRQRIQLSFSREFPGQEDSLINMDVGKYGTVAVRVVRR